MCSGHRQAYSEPPQNTVDPVQPACIRKIVLCDILSREAKGRKYDKCQSHSTGSSEVVFLFFPSNSMNYDENATLVGLSVPTPLRSSLRLRLSTCTFTSTSTNTVLPFSTLDHGRITVGPSNHPITVTVGQVL
jgi:hypothetical protein